MRKVFLFLILGMFLIASVSAICTVTLDKTTYSEGDTATVTGICDENPAEKNVDYTINWTNGTAIELEVDTGTTPSVISTNFFETFIIPSGYVATNGSVLNVNLTSP